VLLMESWMWWCVCVQSVLVVEFALKEEGAWVGGGRGDKYPRVFRSLPPSERAQARSAGGAREPSLSLYPRCFCTET